MDIGSKSGEGFSIGGQVTKPLQPGDPTPWPAYPVNAAGFTLTFVASRRQDDETPLIRKTGTISNGGAWIVAVAASDTASFTKTEELVYEVWLTDNAGNPMQVANGTWSVELSVGP